MSVSKPNKKRSAEKLSPRTSSSSSSPSIVLNGLLDCYNFLSPNEYSDKTFGLLAFILRKSVGEINFSDLIDEVEKHNQHGQTKDFVTLLDDKRRSLHENEASIEKCLMLNRLITYIEENQACFNATISDVRIDMKMKMLDNQKNQVIQYPNDFRQRREDFMKRRHAQNIRRLFYFNHNELGEPPSLIHLQNRTTEHLSYLIDCKLRYDQQFHNIGFQELEKIFASSFMITSHPHAGVNPVIISERKGPGEYKAKVSVIIISLLHDFMQMHPNLIELYDIEPSLWPLSPHYRLEEPQKLSWKTCQLQGCPGDKPRIIQYAELSFITIQTNARIHFNEALHSLKFAIKLHLNLTEYNLSKIYQIPFESLPFGIVTHNSHIPHTLTRVIIDDIRRFSPNSSIDVKIISNFILRYFLHRTGVQADEYLKIYLEQELNKAMNERKNFQTLEDIFMDFLVPFVHQVEFMAKYPILAMFYADGLFLGICNSARAADIMIKSSNVNSSIVGLRFNSIKIDYRSTIISSKTMKHFSCAVRVDIYNNRTKKLQYRTFDSSILTNDINKFVSTAHTEKASYIKILSNLDDKISDENYKSFSNFSKYYNERLNEIYKTNEKYTPVTNLIHNIEDEDENHGNQNPDISDIFLDNPYSVPPPSISTFNHEQTSNIHGNIPLSYSQSNTNEIPLPNVLSTSNQNLNNQDVIQYILSQPHMMTELLHRINILNLSASMQQQQQSYQSQLQMPYQNQPILLPYQQQSMLTPFQMELQGHQQLPPMEFPQQQQTLTITMPNQYQQSSTILTNDIQRPSQLNSTLQKSEDNSTQPFIDPFDFIVTDQTSSITTNQDLSHIFDDLFT